jgi:putative radical SAM enzyme (TIGR03279 family)
LKNFEVLKEIKTCNNNCIFCFIKQLPKGLRSSLYIKDDDYTLAYMYGNFLTLTNISDDDLDKIIRYKLEPLNVSVHSMDSNVRSMIFGSKNSEKGIDNLKVIDRYGIETNIQIVLCPGINDGKKLINTLYLLLTGYDHIRSIGIVPVGLTKFNTERRLKPCSHKYSECIIRTINEFNIKYRYLKAGRKIYLSDEFYILAGAALPNHTHYGDFYQIKNGIGKSTDFLKQVGDYIEYGSIDYNISKKKILVVTSEYGKIVIENALKLIRKNLSGTTYSYGLTIKVLEVKNNFFGGNIKVSGLLTGRDIISGLKKESLKLYEKIIIPDSIFNKDDLTIDDYSKEDLISIDSRIKIISEEGNSFIKEIAS